MYIDANFSVSIYQKPRQIAGSVWGNIQRKKRTKIFSLIIVQME